LRRELFSSSLPSPISTSSAAVLLQVFKDSRFGCSVYTLCFCLKFDFKFRGSVAASDLRCSIGFFLCSSVIVRLFSPSTSLAIETEPEPSHLVFRGNGNFPCVRNRPISFSNL
ncbi:unnamed protein product, partial [Citrullus colocynthis]